MRLKFRQMIFGLVFLIALSAPVGATEDVIQDLKVQIEKLQEQVNRLEAQQNRNVMPVPFGPSHSSDPFAQMERMQSYMNQMFQNAFNNQNGFGSSAFSSDMRLGGDIDMKEVDDKYVLKIDMAGFDEEKFDVEINTHSITVKGERSIVNSEEKANALMKSQSYGSFLRTIPLPMDADTSKVQTQKEGQELIIELPKKKS